MKKLLLSTLLGSALLSGCTFYTYETVTMAQIRSLDYGRYPSNYQQIIRQHLAQTLYDPESVRIDSIARPVKYVYIDRASPRAADKPRFSTGYIVCTRYNAKNRYGGYTGWQTYPFVIRNGQVSSWPGFGCGNGEDIVVQSVGDPFLKVVP